MAIDFYNPLFTPGGSRASGPTFLSARTAAANPVTATATRPGIGTGTVPGLPAGFPGDVTQTTATTNLNAIPTLNQISDLVNQINQAAQQRANQSRLGAGGQVIQDQLIKNTQSNAAGNVPQDVMNLIQQGGVESFGGRGFGVDSPAMNAAVRKALGLTSIGLQDKAAEAYSQLLRDNPSAPIYDVSQGFITPGQFSANQLNFAQLQAELQRIEIARQLMQNEISRTGLAALPRPTPSTRPTVSGATELMNRWLNRPPENPPAPTEPTFTPPLPGPDNWNPDDWAQFENDYWNTNAPSDWDYYNAYLNT